MSALTTQRRLLGLLCVLLLLLPAQAVEDTVTLQVVGLREVCVEEYARSTAAVFFHYIVTAGGSGIRTTVRSSNGDILWYSEDEDENRVLLRPTMQNKGKFTFCFRNKEAGAARGKLISVTVASTMARDHSKREESEISKIAKRMKRATDEIHEIQGYLRIREQRARATTEVANTRVVLFAFAEVFVIISLTVANIFYVNKMFSRKRAV
ncbi:protein ERP2 [Angomonas deanei]|uniref:Emp24/gp25L/p24 family/GOLD, putative n=1 Tax=Angomonas deanei TaxID=59799 RepID=S9WQZ1_9TRYP|nr:protein ERP2 [Angomonas deanei]EPY42466.1 protein ERP2 [Angomonas deanei]CAD2216220.1 emp24/gp25L/p24 family/GOLD, putative [Angomonas deanei]|eukprot:EPY41786.1 protein ERP2 [Angomonas deanei]